MATQNNEKPIHSIVIDTGPLIRNTVSISTIINTAEVLYTTPAILAEIRDPATRSRVETTLLPFLNVKTPTPASFEAVSEFSKKTGDFSVLSKQDLGILALAYEVHCQKNGGSFGLRSVPKGPVKLRPEEQEKLEKEKAEKEAEEAAKEAEKMAKKKEKQREKNARRRANAKARAESKPEGQETETSADVAEGGVQLTEEPALPDATESKPSEEAAREDIQSQPPTEQIGIKTTADSQESSKEAAFPNHDAVGESSSQQDIQQTTVSDDTQQQGQVAELPQTQETPQASESGETKDSEEAQPQHTQEPEQSEQAQDPEENNAPFELPKKKIHPAKARLARKAAERAALATPDPPTVPTQQPTPPTSSDEDSDAGDWITPENLHAHQNQDADADVPLDQSDAQLPVATMTTDYAMQNVLLQMNMHILSPAMQRIRHARSTILRCHACFLTTREMSKQFCPRCGQPTLKRVTCSTNAKGEFQVHLSNKYQHNKRGDKYSIPKPVAGTSNGKHRGNGGGKGGWGRELVLSEDQKEYQKAVGERKKREGRDLMDEDYLPGILTGQRSQAEGKLKVGAGRNVNSRKRF